MTALLVKQVCLKINVLAAQTYLELVLNHTAELHESDVILIVGHHLFKQRHDLIGIKQAVVLKQLLISEQNIRVHLNAACHNLLEALLKVTHLVVEWGGVTIGGDGHLDLVFNLFGLIVEYIGGVIEILECVIVYSTSDGLRAGLGIKLDCDGALFKKELATVHYAVNIKCHKCQKGLIGIALE